MLPAERSYFGEEPSSARGAALSRFLLLLALFSLPCDACAIIARYRMSKAALNAAGVSLAHDLKGDGMSVAILHPGMPRTTPS